MSKKYDALGQYLKARTAQTDIRLSFAEIEAIIGSKLPPSAYAHRPWWSNNPSNNVMTKVWLAAGFETRQVDLAGQSLVFHNKAQFRRELEPRPGGLAEDPREFRDMEAPIPRHPAIGCMKGTFTIEPGYDLTKPALSEEEYAEWEASLMRKADLYEASLKSKK